MSTTPRACADSSESADTASGNKTSYKHILQLAWPQMLMMVFHFLIGFVDVVVAARIDKDVQASLGMISQSLFFFLIVGMAVANGTVTTVSQSLGACLYKRTHRYVGLSLLLALIFGAVFLCVGFLFQETFLNLLRVPAPIRPVTDYFLGVYLLILPAYYLLVITNAIFRAYKWVHLPMFTMLFITTLNTIGDLGLGLGWFGFPNMGYEGLAWATFGSVLGGVLFNLYILRRRMLLSLKAIPPFRWIRVAIMYLFKVAWPAGLSQILWQAGYLVLFAITASLPENSVNSLAGMTAGLRIESILFLPGFAFNMTASILVGHELGAGRPEQAKLTGYRVLGIGVAFITIMSVVVWQFVQPIAEFVSADALVHDQTVNYLYYNIIAIPFTVASMTLGGIMLGAGATLYNLAIFGASTWFVRLPLAYLMGHIFWKDANGIWLAMLISQIVQSSTLLYMFHFKNWQRFALRNKNKNART